MLIIVEGVDGVGKTTFVQELARQILRESPGAEVTTLHKGPPMKATMVEYVVPLQFYRPLSGEHIICDRWYLGELVYGPMFRDGSIISLGEQSYIERFLASKGAVCVYLTAPVDEVVARRAGRDNSDDMLRNRDQIQRVMDLYEEAINRRLFDWAETYWPASPDAREVVVKSVLSAAQAKEESAWRP